MEYSIQELRAFHKLSKPELKKALENTNNILVKEQMSNKTRHVITALTLACKSYDNTIDTLLKEIDRLNGTVTN